MLTALAIIGVGASAPSAYAACSGMSASLAGVMTNANYNNFFPLTIAGVDFSSGSARNPPTMSKQTPCFCPGHIFGLITPGFLVTYFSPQFVGEVVKDPGCFPTVSSSTVLPGFAGQKSMKTTGSVTERRNVHWYEFPLFSLLGIFQDMVCSNSDTPIDIAYATEVDPYWQDDLWSSVLTPEAMLFNNPVALLACIPESVSTAVGYNLDALTWCVSGKLVYPLSGNQRGAEAGESGNLRVLTKFLARQHRVMALYQTIGPTAVCSPHANPIISKSQYRTDPIWPNPKGWGRPVVIGENPMLWGTIASVPTQEDSIFLVWRAVQCCVQL